MNIVSETTFDSLEVDLVRAHTITDPDLKEHIRRHGKTRWERKAAADRP